LPSSASRASERSLRARVAAHTLHASHDSRDLTAAGRRAFLDRFEREVDPERVLAPDERARRAAHARKAHMTRLALRSAEARRLRGAASSKRGRS
jgi:hypothetical protein